MSDLLSPILVTMMDEAHAYICFCAMMQRLRTNFFIDGISMTKKFQHLTDGLLYYDPEFFTYLKLNQADDLLFCYRWLLLEMKREFDFDDCFKVLETLWSSLPPNYPSRSNGGLKLFEVKFDAGKTEGCVTKSSTSNLNGSKGTIAKPSLLYTKKQETAYSKVASLRRQTSGINMSPLSRPICLKERRHMGSNTKDSRATRIRSVGSTESDNTVTKQNKTSASLSTELKDNGRRLVKSQSLVNASVPQKTIHRLSESPISGKKIKDLKVFSNLTSTGDDDNSTPQTTNGISTKEQEAISKLKPIESKASIKVENDDLLSDNDDFSDDGNTPTDRTDDEDVVGYSHFNSACTMKANGSGSYGNHLPQTTGLTLVCQKLPEPTEFGDGNPFLIFLCISCLLQHRSYIMHQQLDYQEIAMYFDKMVRRHNVEKTLAIARKLFAEYLNEDWGANNDDASSSKEESQLESRQKAQKICDDKC